MHIRPAYKEDKEIPINTTTVVERSSFKKEKRVDLMKNLKDETNWNTLFLNPNTVLSYITEKFGITKVYNYYLRQIFFLMKILIKQLKSLWQKPR